ncbi:MAG: hypothetical protein CW341_03180 [Bacteroidetes bacterium]|nr:hypothetical protein [Bacteroidota bacterium]
MRSEADRVYLANKHQGGASNAKGGLYEDYYAVFQIVSCIARYKAALDGVALQTQLEDTFVDDLLIAHPGKNVYHQLKNTQNLTWNTVSSARTITSDFENQIRDCRERNETFALKLVYSAVGNQVGDNIPESIRDYTSAEYFPYEEDLNGLILISDEFVDALRQISVNGYNSTIDELANMAQVFLGVWRGCGNNHKVSLSEIVARAEQTKHFNLNIFLDGVISDACREVLDNIDGLHYRVSGRMFYWRLGDFTGSCPWPEEKEQEIIDKRPTTRRELVAIL